MAERDVLMHEISEMLSIPVVEKGVGSSVHNDFIAPLAVAVLGEDLADEFRDKYGKIRAVIEALGGTYVPADPEVRGVGDTSEGTTSGGGGTLTNVGLRKIWDLLMENGVPFLTYDSDPEVSVLALEGFNPEEILDERVRRQAAVATRPGATKFRDVVREAYGYRCCVSGADAVTALDVAHIAPYQGVKSDAISNALLLRADIHKLHDALLLAVSDEDLTVLIKPLLRETVYADLEGLAVREPRANAISAEALRFHRARCQL